MYHSQILKFFLNEMKRKIERKGPLHELEESQIFISGKTIFFARNIWKSGRNILKLLTVCGPTNSTSFTQASQMFTMIMSPWGPQPRVEACCHSWSVLQHCSWLLASYLVLSLSLVQDQCHRCRDFQEALGLFGPERVKQYENWMQFIASTCKSWPNRVAGYRRLKLVR